MHSPTPPRPVRRRGGLVGSSLVLAVVALGIGAALLHHPVRESHAQAPSAIPVTVIAAPHAA